ncbi:Trp biosynthesis-associated membrane protein [Actinoplanes sp. GCM10030250]|uniref:Trp biosynthesis-associated membrane protein n=1 Tax=Actinoplanes sp. GCM10030250 TaxID=3273376 RepID=UPI00360C7F7B
MNRRTHSTAVVACLAGAGLTLFAATRVWSVQVEERPGLPALRTEQTGAEAQPWLLGLALVALAGAGALLATRGVARRGLGVLLTLTGAGIVVGAVLARAGVETGDAGAGAWIWPAACVLGGAAIAVGGLLAARHGHLWSAMSSRYDRSTAPPPAQRSAASEPSSTGPEASSATGSEPSAAEGSEPSAAVGSEPSSPAGAEPSSPAGPNGGAAINSPGRSRPTDNRAFWEALDRGEDPTR